MQVNHSIQQKLNSYPELIKNNILAIRKMIFAQAKKFPQINSIEETLKWNQISFATIPKTGTPIRVDQTKGKANSISLFFNCQTKLISMIKSRFGEDFNYQGNREIRIDLNKTLPKNQIKYCINLAISYYLEEQKNEK